jgi:type I restriction enzyme M protein
LKKALFKSNRPGYLDLTVETTGLKDAVHAHPEFATFVAGTQSHFATWRKAAAKSLRQFAAGCHPKEVIHQLSEGLLAHYTGQPLLDPYAVYQHLMDYWAETMQDDVYLIAADGWKAETYRILVEDKKGKAKDKGWTCDLVPKALVVARYFAKEQAAIEAKQAELESVTAQLTELEEEHGGEDGLFSELEKINKAEVARRLKEIGREASPRRPKDDETAEEEKALKQWAKLNKQESELKAAIKDAEAELDAAAYAKYPTLDEAAVKTLVVDDKWLATLDTAIHGEIDRVEQALNGRVKELADRYAAPLPELTTRVADFEAKVAAHLTKMGHY